MMRGTMFAALTIVSISILAVVVFYGVQSRGWFAQEGGNTNLAVTNTSDWSTYVNTMNAYTLKFPKDAHIAARSEDEDALPLGKITHVHLFVPGEKTEVYVEAYIHHAASAEIPDFARALDQSAALSLIGFAEGVHQLQIHDKNPYAAGKMVGELKEISFAGQKSYSFTLTRVFTESTDGLYGYALPNGATYNYVFLENHSGTKLMIHYPLGEKNSEAIVASFRLL